MGEKRTPISHSGKRQELHRKRMKMSDLGSAIECAESTKEEQESAKLPLDLNLNTEACCARYSPSNRNGESKGINIDLNKFDAVILEPANSHKSRDVSESGSCCTGPMEEKDPLRKWKEMKQNGFISSSHGGIPVPKPRGRKCKKDNMVKKKMELARKEQVNRFTKIAAPSGLLNELNPGIINHVRNRKQVHSIIEALVRSERNENITSGTAQEVSKRDLETGNCHVTMNGDSCRIMEGKVAAMVASQWLGLLYQDIKGRLSALRRSRRRVRAVIATELPALLLKEFSNNQENDAHAMKFSASNSKIADMHRARWTSLFNQMDEALSHEEKLLVRKLVESSERKAAAM
ncbi:hypothetical protein G2W53_030531 [Senna tora]|uniref:Uncharacterized protein n=1 Tax=Senna tora TaxID=362788 RepID=A0A834WBP2_9FABA|nr:hypothetical protein G2W53_030531 [Senna tora]